MQAQMASMNAVMAKKGHSESTSWNGILTFIPPSPETATVRPGLVASGHADTPTPSHTHAHASTTGLRLALCVCRGCACVCVCVGGAGRARTKGERQKDDGGDAELVHAVVHRVAGLHGGGARKRERNELMSNRRR